MTIKFLVLFFILILFYFGHLILFPSFDDVSQECTGHLKNNHHYHFNLEIRQNKKLIPLPQNVGLEGECIHPLHTHDSTGLVHIDHPRKIKVTLGDFFDTMGVVFSDKQMGNLNEFDGYSLKVFLDDLEVRENFRGIVLKDHSFIRVEALKIDK